MNKLHYIESKINNNEINTEFIISFIEKYNIIYSTNQNGIFINLSKLDEFIVDKLYEYINNYVEVFSNNILNTNYHEKYNIKSIKKKKAEIIKYKINNNLTKVEKDIIKMSKEI
tara:strand:+ start:42 stop:383 length:342 start_codon:yes stop_codon:yes gene_type:complete